MMENEEKNELPQDESRQLNEKIKKDLNGKVPRLTLSYFWLPICFCTGLLLGSTIGSSVFENRAAGMAVGAVIGLVVGYVIEALKKRGSGKE
ncbi:MAG: glycine zipper domain-containing protein [Oscillospiraceae bacterium]